MSSRKVRGGVELRAEKTYLSLTMTEFINDVAAKTPSPGGGCVAANVGALAAATARKVLHYSIEQERPADQQAHLKTMLTALERAGDIFGQLMSEDTAAVERFSAARKSGDAEQLKLAIATLVALPMEVRGLAGAVAARVDEIKRDVSAFMLSELKIAAILSYASARSACAIARINLQNLEDRKEADRLEAQLDVQIARAGRHRNAVVHYQL